MVHRITVSLRREGTAPAGMGVDGLYDVLQIKERKKEGLNFPTFCQILGSKTVAIDSSFLLHRALGRFSGEQALQVAHAQHTQHPPKLLPLLAKKVASIFEGESKFWSNQVQATPIFVFDGRLLPAKLHEVSERRARNRASFEQAQQAWNDGDK